MKVLDAAMIEGTLEVLVVLRPLGGRSNGYVGHQSAAINGLEGSHLTTDPKGI